jgi:hypothetical protein
MDAWMEWMDGRRATLACRAAHCCRVWNGHHSQVPLSPGLAHELDLKSHLPSAGSTSSGSSNSGSPPPSV